MRGESFTLALMSDDKSVTAFARAVPFPIHARDGRCHCLWVEPLSADGYVFLNGGEGFEPSEELAMRSQSAGEVMEGAQKPSDKGSFMTVISPRGVRRNPLSRIVNSISKGLAQRLFF